MTATAISVEPVSNQYVTGAAYTMVCRTTDDAPIVGLHGLGGARAQLDGLPWGGTARTRTMLVPDLRQHGQSVSPRVTTIGFGLLARDVVGLLQHTAIRTPALFVGVSMGAGIALRIAACYPDLVASLILVRPAWGHSGAPEHLGVFRELGRCLDAPSAQSGRAAFMGRTDFQHLHDTAPSLAEEMVASFDLPNRRDVAQMLRQMPTRVPCTPALIEQVRCPAIVLGCEADPIHPLDVASGWADVLPEAELRTVAPRYEEPSTYRAEVAANVERVLEEAVAIEHPRSTASAPPPNETRDALIREGKT